MSDRDHSLVKKGKDCVAIAKNALDDIGSGREEAALKKLSVLKKDGSFLVDAAKELAERLEAVDKHYQNKDAEFLRQIGELNGRESELKSQKSKEESQLATQESVLRENERRLSNAESSLQAAIEAAKHKRKKLKKKKKRGFVKCVVGGAALGVITGGVGLGAVGAVAGAGVGAMALRGDQAGLLAAVNRCRSDLDNACSAVNASKRRISSIESQIRSLSGQMEHMKQERIPLHKKVEEIRAMIVFVKKSIDFWLLFEHISQHGIDRTALLQKIVTRSVESGDYKAFQSKPSQRIADTFIEAWEEMETTAKQGGPNHILEIEYRCSRCNLQCTALPYVDGSTLVCMACCSQAKLAL